MQKLLTIEELSRELGIKRSKIEELVEAKVIFAYRIGGELLRFPKEQIDAQRAEIYARCEDDDRLDEEELKRVHRSNRESADHNVAGSALSFSDRLADFFKFYDFYIVSAILAGALIFYILKG